MNGEQLRMGVDLSGKYQSASNRLGLQYAQVGSQESKPEETHRRSVEFSEGVSELGQKTQRTLLAPRASNVGHETGILNVYYKDPRDLILLDGLCC